MPGPLFTYMQDTYRLLGRDETQSEWNPDDIIAWINIARGEVAAQGQCIRRESPISGSVLSINVTAAGSGYTNPTATISAPDAPSGFLPYPAGAQATAVAQQIGGGISNISVSFGGSGYFQPTVTISDPTGAGATATATITPIQQTTFNQENYNFSDIPISAFPGVASVLAVPSVTVLWTNIQWTCINIGYRRFMATVRNYVYSYNAPPAVCAQFGQGVDGSLRLFPRPDQNYQLVFDCLCLPSDLIDDNDFEAIPEPWRKAVPFYAAHLGLLSKASITPQFADLAFRYFNEKDGGLFGVHMRRARAFSNPGKVGSFYGRTRY